MQIRAIDELLNCSLGKRFSTVFKPWDIYIEDLPGHTTKQKYYEIHFFCLSIYLYSLSVKPIYMHIVDTLGVIEGGKILHNNNKLHNGLLLFSTNKVKYDNFSR